MEFKELKDFKLPIARSENLMFFTKEGEIVTFDTSSNITKLYEFNFETGESIKISELKWVYDDNTSLTPDKILEYRSPLKNCNYTYYNNYIAYSPHSQSGIDVLPFVQIDKSKLQIIINKSKEKNYAIQCCGVFINGDYYFVSLPYMANTFRIIKYSIKENKTSIFSEVSNSNRNYYVNQLVVYNGFMYSCIYGYYDIKIYETNLETGITNEYIETVPSQSTYGYFKIIEDKLYFIKQVAERNNYHISVNLYEGKGKYSLYWNVENNIDSISLGNNINNTIDIVGYNDNKADKSYLYQIDYKNKIIDQPVMLPYTVNQYQYYSSPSFMGIATIGVLKKYILELPPPPPPPEGPYKDPPSEPSIPGGSGSFDKTNNNIIKDNSNIKGVIDDSEVGGSNDMFTLYNPADLEMEKLGEYFWSESPAATLSKWFVNAPDCFISWRRVPYVPSSVRNPDKAHTIIYGPGVDSGVSTAIVTKQYEFYDMGDIEIKEYFGSFLDYSPYTTMQLYLPFVGFVPIKPEEVVNSKVNVKYRIDNFTGAFLVTITVTKGELNSELYYYTGKMGSEIPITSFNFKDIVKSIVSTSASIVAMGAAPMAGAITAPKMLQAAKSSAVDRMASIPEKRMAKEINYAKNHGKTYISPVDEYNKFEHSVQLDIANKSIYAITNSASSIVEMANTAPETRGVVSSELGAFTYGRPFLLIYRPSPSVPESYAHHFGYPCNMTKTVKDLKGLTVFDSVFIENVDCTDKEKDIIEEILKGGILL